MAATESFSIIGAGRFLFFGFPAPSGCAATAACDDRGADRNRDRLPRAACIPQEFSQMYRFGSISQAQFFERASALGKVNIFALKPKYYFVRSRKRSPRQIWYQLGRPWFRLIRSGAANERSATQQQCSQRREIRPDVPQLRARHEIPHMGKIQDNQ